MLVRLAYGREGLAVDLPEEAQVIEPRYNAAIAEPLRALRQALAQPIGTPPLQELLRPTQRITVVHCDGTRPMPNAQVLAALGEVFASARVPDSHVTLLNALGTHRENTPEEMARIVGRDALGRYRSVQSRSTDRSAMRQVGRMRDGTPVELHQAYAEADIRILLGFIEPHFFAGFSGGPKPVVPGVASQETVQHVHRAELVANPRSTWGIREGNPLWEALYEAATLEPPTFIVNVTLNDEKQITSVFAGSLNAAHRRGCEYVRERAMCPVARAFDIVVTTNSGFPLDQNLYQTVKGMSAAARIVKPGGAIVVAARCADGIPDHGEFRSLVLEGGSVEGVLQLVQSPGFSRADQWQAQVLAQVRQRARVYLYSEGIRPEDARAMLLEPIDDVAETVGKLAAAVQGAGGGPATICVMPEGPQTIPYLAGE